jgi:arylsulfatase A-like enzyme
VQLIDLFPTVLSACGVETDVFTQGVDLSPLLSDETIKHPNAALVEFDANLRIDMSLNVSGKLGPALVKVADPDEILRVRTLRSDDWALTLYSGKPYGELFDLQNDPGEFVNLWDNEGSANKKLELIGELYALTLRTDPPARPRQAHY